MDQHELQEILKVSGDIIQVLIDGGYSSLEELAMASMEDLSELGIIENETAKIILLARKELGLVPSVRQRVAPVRSEFIRISDQRTLQIKLWPPRPSKYGRMRPANVEIQEVNTKNEDDREYGASIQFSASGSSFMVAEYLVEFLKEARTLNQKEYRKESKNKPKKE